MRHTFLKLATVAFFALSSTVFAESNNETLSNTIRIFSPDKMQWSEGPASLPKGAQMTVLEGNPKANGPFTIRVKIPANYRVMPHTHEGPEHVTVISGSLYLGQGAKFDEKIAKRINAGSFALILPNTAHFGFTKNETVIQLHGMGPWMVNYINPADNPKNS